MTDKNGDYIVGIELDQLSSKLLEQKIEKNPFVKNTEVYRDIRGLLSVRVQQSIPIARILSPKGDDHYIDEQGYIIPTNEQYTARVPLVEFDFDITWEKNLKESSYGEKFFKLLSFVDQDQLWRVQIAYFSVDDKGSITMYPQVSKQLITFGQPVEVEEKFNKLKIFYKKILPLKGWGTYKSVNLKFENQIICDKNDIENG